MVAVAAWILVWPLTLVVPRKTRLVAVLGRDGFSDNSKHFYALAAGSEGLTPVFLSGQAQARREIEAAGGTAMAHPSLRSLVCLLRCSCLVSDVSDWFSHGAYALTSGAKRVQIWHGAPLKLIELADYRERVSGMNPWWRRALWGYKAAIGRYPLYDLVVTTSDWLTENAFRSSFRSRRFQAFGYPRNDVLLPPPGLPPPGIPGVTQRLLEINVDTRLRGALQEAKAAGLLCCLYAPTFRRTMRSPFDGPLDLGALSRFAVERGIVVVLKLHPFVKQASGSGPFPNILVCEPASDIYPLLPEMDVLITDYSSIFFDFLLLDRPVVFFPYDLEDYLETDRSMYFDYQEMTPGPKCFNQPDLLNALGALRVASGADVYAAERQRVRTLIHDHCDDEASARLVDFCAGS